MLRSVILLLWICTALWISAEPMQTADIGSKVQNIELTDAHGRNHSLTMYSGKILVLVFWSYKCPSSNNYTHRMDALQNAYDPDKVVVLGVASGRDQTAAGIRANKANLKVSFPVLLDTEGELAARLNATRTPSVFIIDGNGILRYRGAFDNDMQDRDRQRKAYAEDAIKAILGGRSVAVPETRAEGCIIRR